MRSLLASILLSCAACAISACTGSGQVTYSGEAAGSLDLVEISPGVQVIADYDEPVFYSDNYYWREQGGVWYRSHDHQRGWERSEAPERVRSIQRPEAYVHYHASGNTNARADVRDHRTETQQPNYPRPNPAPAPEVRDHREGSPTFPAPQPGAGVRDHRDDRRDGAGPQPQPQPAQPQPRPQTRPPDAAPQRDVRQDDRKDDRKDDRREQKDQRKDEREQRKDDKKR